MKLCTTVKEAEVVYMERIINGCREGYYDPEDMEFNMQIELPAFVKFLNELIPNTYKAIRIYTSTEDEERVDEEIGYLILNDYSIERIYMEGDIHRCNFYTE